MGEKRTWSLECVLSAAVLIAMALADEPHDSMRPVDLKKDAFDVTLQALPSGRGVLMEFYAAWCPACKHFQPHYEKVAAYFYGSPRPKPEVYVARVDCATEAALCSLYNIGHYPTLRFGRPADFEVGRGKLEEYSGVREEKEIVEWVGKLQSTAYDFDPLKEAQAFQQAAPVAKREETAPKPPQHVDLNDIESSTILSFRYIAEMGDGLAGLEKRQALKDWLELLARSHPLKRCTQGAQSALDSLPQIWPPGAAGASAAALGQVKICGAGVSIKEWGSCRGSRETSRGYTCGLWLLLHSLAARSTPPETVGAFWMAAVRQFVEQFFQCSECSQHFGAMAAEEAALAVTTQRDAVLWAWRAHNIVNKRVADEEFKDHSGDPFFPKAQWPTPELCPLCRAPSVTAGAGKGGSEAEPEWNEDEVYRFLVRFYGDAGEKVDAAAAAYFGGRKGLSGKVEKARRHSGTIAKAGGIALVALAAYVLVRNARGSGRKGASIL